MRHILPAVPVALLFATTAGAQPVRSFEDLSRLEAGVRILIVEGSDRESTGRFIRATADEITIDTDRGEQQFAREQVRAVALKERFTQIGTFVGAAVGAAIGADHYCRGAGDHPECADAMVLYGGIGCGIGALGGLAIPRTRIIFRSSEPRVYLAPRLAPHAVAVVAIRRW
jgi:hypothetical protein